METETKEWKREWKSEYLKIIASFFNTSGGELIIGIDDNGKAVGLDNSKKLLEEIPTTIRNKLGITPSVEAIPIDGKKCIKITIEKGNHLIDLDGRFYKRIGSTTHMITGEELQSLILSEMGSSWTDLPSNEGLDSISEEAIEYFVKAGKLSNRLPQDMRYDAKTVLERFDLMDQNGHLIRAGSLLFGKNTSNPKDGMYVKIGEFSDDGQLRREDRILVPLITQPDAVIDKLYEKYIPGFFEYEGASRNTIFRYPKDAIREAIVNSIVHKKYDSFEPITIRVDLNELSIYNSGPLPEGWTIEDLKGTHKSVRRNKRIADVFHQAGFVETSGKGIDLIRSSCKANGNPEPIFNVRQGGLEVRFTPNRIINHDAVSKLPTGLNDTEINVCTLINENNSITVKAMTERLNVTERTVKRALSSLTEKGIIMRVGPNKGGFWRLL